MPVAEIIESAYLERARVERGVDFGLHPAKRVVVTGLSNMTAFGGTQETWDGFLTNASGVRQVEVAEGIKTSIAAPLPEGYNPMNHLYREVLSEEDKAAKKRPREDDRYGLSLLAALEIVKVREALAMAGLLDPDLGGQIINYRLIHPYWMTSTLASGISAADQIIEVHKDVVAGKGSRIKPSLAQQIFPEEPAGRVAIALGYQGRRSKSPFEACATSLSSVTEGYDILKQGFASVVVAGGFETALETHRDEVIGDFSSLTALSERNDEPERASRPFDKDRDGFVVASGGGVAIIEDEEFARARGVNILAEIFGVSKTQDGNAISFDAAKPMTTEMDPVRVADTIVEAMLTPDGRAIMKPDVFWAHATSTKVGDRNELRAFRYAFGRYADDILVTAIKSRIGHALGGAGIINFNLAVQSILEGKIPSILNLDNPDPEIGELNYVRDRYLEETINSALVVAYGFGRYNAAVHVGRYIP